MKRVRSRLGRVASVVLSVLAVLYLILRLDWAELTTTLAGASWTWLSLAFLVYLLNYALRTLRFRHFLNARSVPFSRLIGVTTLHGMFNYLLPGRSGEISYPLLLRRQFGIRLSEGASGLIVSRFLDFIIIATLLPLVLLFFWDSFPLLLNVILLAFCVIVAFTSIVGVRLLKRSETGLPPAESPVGNSIRGRLRRALGELSQGLSLIKREGGFLYLFLLTSGIWLTVYLNFYVIVLSLGYSVELLHIIVVSIVMVPVTLLPIQGFANIGTHEIGWVAALSLFDYTDGLALQIAVGSHSVLILFVVLLAGTGYLLGGAGNLRPAIGEG